MKEEVEVGEEVEHARSILDVLPEVDIEDQKENGVQEGPVRTQIPPAEFEPKRQRDNVELSSTYTY